ncbi:MAG: 3-deoxy-D-manno-octulosonic acid transferase [Bacteroidales bacterium]|nr:3-deoxy-D-manno-octulosonic acid transferase [Bacteroidales bacterium]
MKITYIISVFLYSLLIKVASVFNKKAKLRNNGIKSTFKTIENFNPKKIIWVHCASLGEFEQGRPLIEKIKKEKPEYQIALSFFSPSGYEVRKNYKYADIVFYLPDDSKKNAKKLIQLLKPELAFFIKYEFWYQYLSELNKNNIPVYLVSGIFRKNQIFFKPYGGFYRKILHNFKCLFVQNELSKQLLKSIDITDVKVTGDTRFDRVFELSKNRNEIEIIEKFKENSFVLIAGSTWKPDDEIIIKFFNQNKPGIKLILAPHEIKSENISRIIRMFDYRVLKYSEANLQNISEANILLIDNIGLLSSLYYYADISYIGGGFGKGIHNTLEAAVFGMPIIFGPKYGKFDEAKELIKQNAAFSIRNYQEFSEITDKLVIDSELRAKSGTSAKLFVTNNIGAAEKILTSALN